MTVTGYFEFDDPVAGVEVALVMHGAEPSFWDGSCGVEHAGCGELADVSPELDAFYCRHCRRSGRLSGAWAVEKLQAVRAGAR